MNNKIILGIVLVLLFLVVLMSTLGFGSKSPPAMLNYTDSDHMVAIARFNLSPSIVARCEDINDSVYFIVMGKAGNCSAWSLGTLDYMIACVEITEKGWVDNCGVLSSEARKKLSASNNAFG